MKTYIIDKEYDEHGFVTIILLKRQGNIVTGRIPLQRDDVMRHEWTLRDFARSLGATHIVVNKHKEAV